MAAATLFLHFPRSSRHSVAVNRRVQDLVLVFDMPPSEEWIPSARCTVIGRSTTVFKLLAGKKEALLAGRGTLQSFSSNVNFL